MEISFSTAITSNEGDLDHNGTSDVCSLHTWIILQIVDKGEKCQIEKFEA